MNIDKLVTICRRDPDGFLSLLHMAGLTHSRVLMFLMIFGEFLQMFGRAPNA